MTAWVEIREKGKRKVTYGYVNNISMNGAAFFSAKAPLPGTVVLLTLNFFGYKDFQTVKDVEGMVVWSCKKGSTSSFGIVFQEVLTPERSTGLFGFIDEASKSIHEEIESLVLVGKEYYA